MIQVRHQIDPFEKIVAVGIMVCLLHHNIEIMMISILNQIDRIGMMLEQQAMEVAAFHHLRLYSTEIIMMSTLHQVDLIEEKDPEMIVATGAAKITSPHLVSLPTTTTNSHLVNHHDRSLYPITLHHPSPIEVIVQQPTFHPA